MSSNIIITQNKTPKIEISKIGTDKVSINLKGNWFYSPDAEYITALENYLEATNSLTALYVGSDNILDLIESSGGSAEWGDITGTLADQIDLMNALDAKSTISGTPVQNQVAIWNSALAIKGDSKITWDGSTLLVDGDIKATGDIVAYYSP